MSSFVCFSICENYCTLSNELADMFIGIADGTKDETELRYWINDHIECKRQVK